MNLQEVFLLLASVVLILILVWNLLIGFIFIKTIFLMRSYIKEINFVKNGIKFTLLKTLLGLLKGGDDDAG